MSKRNRAIENADKTVPEEALWLATSPHTSNLRPVRMFHRLRQARSSYLHSASEPCISNNPTAPSVHSIPAFVAKVSLPDLESVGQSGPSGSTEAGPQGHAFPARRLWPETGISSGGESDLTDASHDCSFYSCQEEGSVSNSDLTGSSCAQSTDLDKPGRNPISSQDWP